MIKLKTLLTEASASNLDTWMAAYQKNLLAVVNDPKYAADYGWSGEVKADNKLFQSTVAKMQTGFLNKSFNKDGIAIKRTCKELNVPYTYAGINSFIHGASVPIPTQDD